MSNPNTRISSLAVSCVNKLLSQIGECQAPKHELSEVD